MQYSLFDQTDWKESVREMLEALIKEYELPPGSLYLSDNFGKKKTDQIISHTIFIWEPEFPPVANEQPGRTRNVITLKYMDNNPDIFETSIGESQEIDTHEYLPKGAEVLERTGSDIDSGVTRLRIPKNAEGLTEYLKRNTIHCVERYDTKSSSFGCCSSFIECSDAKKCVHENKLYSTACMYRRNLENGRIFYGKNKNV